MRVGRDECEWEREAAYVAAQREAVQRGRALGVGSERRRGGAREEQLGQRERREHLLVEQAQLARHLLRLKVYQRALVRRLVREHA